MQSYRDVSELVLTNQCETHRENKHNQYYTNNHNTVLYPG